MTAQDARIAELLFAGDTTYVAIGEIVGLNERTVRRIASGERRSHVKARVEALGRDLQARERRRLTRVKSQALAVLADALDAVTADGRPNHHVRIKAAIALRNNFAEVIDNAVQPMTQADAVRLLDERDRKMGPIGPISSVESSVPTLPEGDL